MKIPSSSSTFLLVAAIIVIFLLPPTNAQNAPNGIAYTQNLNVSVTPPVELTCDHPPPEPGPHKFDTKGGGLTWVFRIPESEAKTLIYKCTVTWNDKKAEITVYDGSFPEQGKCKSPVDRGNLCSWAAVDDGIYFSAEEFNYPGRHSWKLAVPWSPK